MFEEKQEYDVTIRPSGHLEVRRSDIVLKDGVEIARSYCRHIVTPGDETTDEIQMVKDLAEMVWTEDMIDAAKLARTEATAQAEPLKAER